MNIAYGEDLIIALDNEDFVSAVAHIKNNNGDIVGYEPSEDKIEELFQHIRGSQDFRQITKKEFLQIKKLFIKQELTITKENFLEWYFNYGSDQEINDMIESIGLQVRRDLKEYGRSTTSVESLFNSIDQGLIPYKFVEECDDKESYTELQDLFNEFNLKLK